MKVKDDLAERLGIKNEVIFFQSSFNRPNLIYQVIEKKKISKADEHIEQMLNTQFKNKSGLIYCLSRKDCERLSDKLKRMDIKCEFYHADIPLTRRTQI